MHALYASTCSVLYALYSIQVNCNIYFILQRIPIYEIEHMYYVYLSTWDVKAQSFTGFTVVLFVISIFPQNNVRVYARGHKVVFYYYIRMYCT